MATPGQPYQKHSPCVMAESCVQPCLAVGAVSNPVRLAASLNMMSSFVNFPLDINYVIGIGLYIMRNTKLRTKAWGL